MPLLHQWGEAKGSVRWCKRREVGKARTGVLVTKVVLHVVILEPTKVAAQRLAVVDVVVGQVV